MITTLPTTVEVELFAEAVHVTSPVVNEHTTSIVTTGLNASQLSEKEVCCVTVPSGSFVFETSIVTVTPVVVVPVNVSDSMSITVSVGWTSSPTVMTTVAGRSNEPELSTVAVHSTWPVSALHDDVIETFGLNTGSASNP